MKKLVFMFVAMVAMTFAACGGQTAGTEDLVICCDKYHFSIVDSLAVDSVVADSAVAE